MAEFVDNILDSIDENGNLAGESLVESATSESSGEGQQVTSTPDGIGSSKSNETIAPVVSEEEKGERGSSGVNENGVTSSNNEGEEEKKPSNQGRSASETDKRDAGKGNHREDGGRKRKVSEMSALEIAEHKAERWKRRAKEMRRDRDRLEAEFNKYKDLNPRAFESDEDRMDFLAWRASTAQRLNDMDSDLDALDEEQGREEFQAKVADFYNESGSVEFEKLDDHYRGAFDLVCSKVDPDNVIQDFLSGSRYEAPMREVIYKNGLLQEELFRNFRNPMIASAERLNTLKKLEAQVKDFYSRGGQQSAPKGVNAGTAQAERFASNVQPQTIKTQEQMGVRQRFVLPSMQNRVANATANVNRTQNVAPQQGRPMVGNPMAGKKATGSLTRGSEPAQQMDLSSQADALFKELLRSGM